MRNGPSKVVFRVHSPENGVVALEPEHFYPAVYTLSSAFQLADVRTLVHSIIFLGFLFRLMIEVLKSIYMVWF